MKKRIDGKVFDKRVSKKGLAKMIDSFIPKRDRHFLGTIATAFICSILAVVSMVIIVERLLNQ